MNLKSLIAEARSQYRASGVKLHLPHRDHVSTPGYVRLSALDGCPLQHAYEKLKVEPDFPELTPEGDPSKAWIMDHGNYVAPMIQEALMWWAMHNAFYGFAPEVPVISHELKAVGRIDGVLLHEELMIGGGTRTHKRILEIKDTEGVEKRSIGEPKLSYCLQALAYCLLTGIEHASIITVSKWGYNVYDLEPVSEGRYRLLFDDGTPYSAPVWMEGFNNTDTLSFDRVKQELQRLHDYMVDADDERNLHPPVAPIQPVNDLKSWLCARVLDKGTKTRHRTIRPNCPWAGRCHGLQNKVYEVEKLDDGTSRIVREEAF